MYKGSWRVAVVIAQSQFLMVVASFEPCVKFSDPCLQDYQGFRHMAKAKVMIACVRALQKTCNETQIGLWALRRPKSYSEASDQALLLMQLNKPIRDVSNWGLYLVGWSYKRDSVEGSTFRWEGAGSVRQNPVHLRGNPARLKVSW